jgi:hypothetical protein
MSFFNDLFGTAKDVVSLPVNIIRNPSGGLGTVSNTISGALGTAKGLTSTIPGVNTVSQYIPSGGGSAATVTGNVVGGF